MTAIIAARLWRLYCGRSWPRWALVVPGNWAGPRTTHRIVTPFLSSWTHIYLYQGWRVPKSSPTLKKEIEIDCLRKWIFLSFWLCRGEDNCLRESIRTTAVEWSTWIMAHWLLTRGRRARTTNNTSGLCNDGCICHLIQSWGYHLWQIVFIVRNNTLQQWINAKESFWWGITEFLKK